MECFACGFKGHRFAFKEHHVTEGKTVILCSNCHKILTASIFKIFSDIIKRAERRTGLKDIPAYERLSGGEVRRIIKEHHIYRGLASKLQELLVESWHYQVRRWIEGYKEAMGEP